MSQKIENVLDSSGKLMLDRVRVTGFPLPSEGMLFLRGRTIPPVLPLRLYEEMEKDGNPFRFAVDSKKQCWIAESWVEGLALVPAIDLESRLLLDGRLDLLAKVEKVLGRKTNILKCHTCGAVVPRNRHRS